MLHQLQVSQRFQAAYACSLLLPIHPYLPATQGSLKIYIPNKQNQFPLLSILVTIAHFFNQP